MAYTKQNFENGQVLTAEQLNHMEQGIEDAENPFGTELVEVLPETVITLTEDGGILPEGFAIEGDTEYEITFNGVKYVCTSVDLSALGGIIYVGNDGLMGNDSVRTEPFCIITATGDLSSSLAVADTAAASCSVSVVQRAVRKIPEKYAPYSFTPGDTLYWDGSMVGREVIDEPADTGTVIYVKVSDVVLSEEDLVNGVIIRECVSGSWVTTEIPGPLTYTGGILHFGVLLPTVALFSGSANAGIYFVITKADFGTGMFELRAASLTVPGYGKFNSCPTLLAEAVPKYLDDICVDKLILRSPAGKLFSLGISDEGQAQILPVGITE